MPRRARDKNRDLVLYRFFDNDGTLLYVGKSIQVWERFLAHKRTSAFYPVAAKITLQRGFGSHQELLDAEKAAIFAEQPKFNETYKSSPGWERRPITGCFCGPESLKDGTCCRPIFHPSDFDVVTSFVRGLTAETGVSSCR